MIHTLTFIVSCVHRPRHNDSRLNRRWVDPRHKRGPLTIMATYGLPTMVNSPLITASSPVTVPDDSSSSPRPASMYPPLSAFPKHLPTIFVPADAERKYGLASKASRSVRQEIKDFVDWSTTSVQLDRSVRYSASVQRTTTDKHETCILAYLGFLVNIKGDIAIDEASLSAYCSPMQFAGFMAFLQARDVGRGHALKHVSLARKINNYLISGKQAPICMQIYHALHVIIISLLCYRVSNHYRRHCTWRQHGHMAE